MTEKQFIVLLNGWRNQRLTQDEYRQFITAVQSLKFDELLDDALEADLDAEDVSKMKSGQLTEESLSALLRRIETQSKPVPTTHNIRFLKSSWFRYAAALLLIAGTAAYLLVTTKTSKGPGETVRNNTITDISPGTNRAVLKVGNTAIDLSSEKTGIAVNGTIMYNDGERISEAHELLELSTPRGGQYQAVLPDGSRVWLNAASSITFPSKFDGKERRVVVTGELYFEVVKNDQQPFVVDINHRSTVNVLGTNFNVNGYSDDPLIKTTLLQGSIKVIEGNRAAILQPGQQALIKEGNITLDKNANIDQAIAWKNGAFNFEGASLQEVMKQLARWYDIDIVYDKDVPAIAFGGKMSRSLSLSGLLRVLKNAGINFRMEEGRRLIVTP